MKQNKISEKELARLVESGELDKMIGKNVVLPHDGDMIAKLYLASCKLDDILTFAKEGTQVRSKLLALRCIEHGISL